MTEDEEASHDKMMVNIRYALRKGLNIRHKYFYVYANESDERQTKMSNEYT